MVEVRHLCSIGALSHQVSTNVQLDLVMGFYQVNGFLFSFLGFFWWNNEDVLVESTRFCFGVCSLCC